MALHPIGRLRTPFATLRDCPRNGRQPAPPGCTVPDCIAPDCIAPDCIAEVDEAYAEGLAGLESFSHLILLYWLGPQPGLLTITPRFDGRPRGVFASRALVRPNPIALSVVSLHGIDGRRLHVRNLDCRDNTPLLDIKPYLPTTDSEPAASMGWLAA